MEVSPDRGMLRLLLSFAGRAAAVAGRLGADRRACEAILEARLRIDMRTGGLRNPQKPDTGGLWLTCLSFLFMGLAVAAFVGFAKPDATRAMAAVQAYFMLMMAMLLVSDYLPSLIDPAESHMLAPRPVSGRTLLLTRIAHFVLYMALPVACLLVPSWLVGLFRDDTLRWMLVFPVLSLLVATLVMSSLMIAFLVALERLDGDRLSAVLLRAQIVSSFAVFGGYYLGIGLIMNETVGAWLQGDHALQVLLPPYWFGGLYGLLQGRTDLLVWVLAALAVLVPVLLAVVMLRLAGPRLATGLASMDRGGADVTGKRGVISRLARHLVQPGLEQAGFDMFLSLSVRERGFKSRVYPLLVVPFVMFLWFALRGKEMQHGSMMSVTVLPLMYGLLILLQVRFSDTPQAAWIFGATPLEKPGLFVSGVVKGVAFAFVLPWMLLVMTAGTVMQQGAPVMDVVFAALMAIALILRVARSVAVKSFPFSKAFTTGQAQATGLVMLGFLLVGVLAGVQALLKEVPFGQVVGAIVLVPVVLWQARSLREVEMDRRVLPVV